MILLEWLSLIIENFDLYFKGFIHLDYIFSISNWVFYLLADNNHTHVLLSMLFSILSGIVVGFSLGLVGGGGSILAVPLLVYVIGVDTHIAIGTSALAVAANALLNLSYRIGKRCIKIKDGILFAIPGVL